MLMDPDAGIVDHPDVAGIGLNDPIHQPVPDALLAPAVELVVAGRIACSAQPRPDWKPHPWTIHFFIGQDAFETGCTTVTEAARVLTPLLSQSVHRANMGSAGLAGKTERFR